MDFVTRLRQFMTSLGLTNSQFADRADIARPTLSQILNGRNKKISNELIEKLHNVFPQLNILWLLFGDGPMLLDGSAQSSAAETPSCDASLFDGAPDASAQDTASDEDMPCNPVHTPAMAQESPMGQSQASEPWMVRSEDPVPYGMPKGHPLSSDNVSDPVQRQGQSRWGHQVEPAGHSCPASGHPSVDEAPLGVPVDRSKRVAYIMVFYTDNSYEVFHRSENV